MILHVCMVGQIIIELQYAHISDDLSFDIIKTIKTFDIIYTYI